MDSQRVCSGERIVRFSSPIDAADQLLELLLEVPSSSIGNSLEKLIDSRISQLKVDAADKALKLGNALAETAKMSVKKLYAKHNAESWSLPVDLTVKVFCMLDKQSLCRAAATCCLLNKCANDSSCYANIDLITTVPKVNDVLVCRFVQRAGKSLRSLKIGLLTKQKPGFLGELDQYESYSLNKTNKEQGAESSFLTGSCLFSLKMGKDKAGSLLRSLHLYNIDGLDTLILCAALSVCRSLIDLEVVGMKANLRQTLECISSNCHLMERLVLKSRNDRTHRRDVSLKSMICHGLVKSCPSLSSLSLMGFRINDHQARILMKGLLKLKFVDLSSSYSITGSFLKNLGSPEYVLEDLILRDCPHLEETKVACLLAGLLTGDFKFLRTLDVSNKNGLATVAFDYYKRCYDKRNLPLAQLKVDRPGLVVCADFPIDQRDDDSDETEDSFAYGEEYGQFYFDGDSEVSEDGSLREEVNIWGNLDLSDYFGTDFHDDFLW